VEAKALKEKNGGIVEKQRVPRKAVCVKNWNWQEGDASGFEGLVLLLLTGLAGNKTTDTQQSLHHVPSLHPPASIQITSNNPFYVISWHFHFSSPFWSISKGKSKIQTNSFQKIENYENALIVQKNFAFDFWYEKFYKLLLNKIIISAFYNHTVNSF
jgi:hypothetical protein